jgi:hypothetical protein
MAKGFTGLLAALVLIAPCSVQAWCDVFNTPNSISIYFDEQATQNVVSAGIGETLQAYVVLREPALPIIDEWVLGFGTGGAFRNFAPRNGVPTNVDGGGLFQLNEPLELGEITVLGTLELEVYYDGPIEVSVSLCGHISYLGEEVELGNECWFIDMSGGIAWVATINGETPVSTTVETWSSVKALYR